MSQAKRFCWILTREKTKQKPKQTKKADHYNKYMLRLSDKKYEDVL